MRLLLPARLGGSGLKTSPDRSRDTVSIAEYGDFGQALIVERRLVNEMPKQHPGSPKPVEREEFLRLAGEVMSIREALAEGRTSTAARWWNYQWVNSLGSAMIAGVLAFLAGTWQSGKAHDADDLKRDIVMEVSKQLEPIRQELQNQGKDIAKIKGADGIAQLAPGPGKTKSVKSLSEIGTLGQKQFAASLPNLYAEMRKVSAPQSGANEATLRAITDKLRHVDENTPEYWSTVLQFIRFVSARHAPDVPPPGPANLEIGFNTGFPSLGVLSRRRVLLDGGEIEDSVFENCRILFTSNPVHMRNVRFVNCVFEIPEGVVPDRYIKHAAKELLASNFSAIVSL